MFDTTGVGYFKAGKKVPEVAALNEALVKARVSKVKVTRLTEVELPKAEAVFEVTVNGLG